MNCNYILLLDFITKLNELNEKLNKKEPNAIILVQARLYRAKSLVDTCVTVALLSVAILPQSEISYYIDLIGSVIVALYLMWCGIKTIYERAKG